MPVTVVAALVWKEGKVLICQRRAIDIFPGKWEFPGGKIERGEGAPAALARELFEELGICARIGEQVAQIDHHYPGHAAVHLLFYTVTDFDGLVENRIFQQILWVQPEELSRFDFLEADRPVIARLAVRQLLPPVS